VRARVAPPTGHEKSAMALASETAREDQVFGAPQDADPEQAAE